MSATSFSPVYMFIKLQSPRQNRATLCKESIPQPLYLRSPTTIFNIVTGESDNNFAGNGLHHSLAQNDRFQGDIMLLFWLT